NETNLDDTAPVITGPSGSAGDATSAISVNENQTAVTTPTANEAVTWSLVGGEDQAKFAIDSTTGALTFVAAPDFETPTDGTTSGSNTYIVQVRALDAAGNFSVQTITVTVLDVNEATAPVFTNTNATDGSSNPSYGFNYAENRASGATLGTVSATGTGTLSYSITAGNADGWFAIDASTGAITLSQAGSASLANDFETQANVQNLTVQVSDGTRTTSIEVKLNETNLDDTAPVITGPSGSAGDATSAISVNENQTAVTTPTANETVTWSLVGGEDQAKFAIDSTTGALTFVAAPDFEVPTDGTTSGSNTYIVQVRALDAAGNFSVQTITVTVLNVNDGGPAFTGTNATGAGNAAAYSFDYAENTAVGATLGTVAAADPDGTAVTFSITAGNADGWFAINTSTGVITLTQAGSTSLANNFEVTPNLQTLTVSASDGTTATLIEVRLNETNVDDIPPAITGPSGTSGSAVDSLSVNEGQTTVARLTASKAVSWSITSGNDRGKFQIAADGTITFVAAPDFESPTDTDTNNTYVLTVTATDAAGNISTQTITVTVLNIDDTAPAITGPSGGPGAAASALTITEGLTAVTRFTANEPVTWSIDSGADAAKFRIDAATGTIVFVAAPDFENPTDSDRNNSYVVRIKAVDAAGNVSFQTLTVTITNVDEIARKLGQIGDKLRGSLRNYAAHGLSDMLAFNETLMASNDNFCADPKTQKGISGSARANENGANLDLNYTQRLSDCSRPHQIFADAGLSSSRMDGNWSSRAFGALRFETKFNNDITLGLAALVSRSSDKLTGFDTSAISDKSLQVNAYGRYRISDTLRTGAFIGYGKTWYDFALTESDGFDLDGSMTGKRQVYGWMLSGDFNLGDTVVTTDAVISHAREKIGSATLTARYLGEDRSGIAFAVGTVDVTRISVPVTAPITLSGSADYGSWTRLLLGPGLLCEDNDVQSSGLRCGYQLGAKLVANDGGRARFYADYNWESVAGMRRSLIAVGYAYRLGNKNNLELAVEANRGLNAMTRQDNRAMLSIRLAQ
ncbi:cadherin domain-containing protein, partial [Sphingorhabdus sp.]|uniref:cadherin domain-containing protein n=1 Tax=Sphingorhabdus sp. TaxID=1902408 RepID=UPI00378480BD